MGRGNFVTRIFEVKSEEVIVVYGLGKPKEIRLPREVVEWMVDSYPITRILEEAINHYSFRRRLSHPGAIRSLILLLYARGRGEPPYKVARRYGVAPEQLYRMERGLKKDGMYEFVMNALSLASG
ncbi:hypothetical protein [Aeropyrum camini]|uniref:Transposase n=1 Tax=Aeropyrum camini SY1 = JCM 12091 TaxID=1198449 RepID=U3TD78_9CREN|nr:hypothetical protein [Aeropyrum camini]BAN89928.1 hypothetical protein ACAM_0459 [Aeropyrum camini SY1 = JCM 12091]